MFKGMISKKTSLQNSLNEIARTGGRESYVTRIWSTCSRMLTIKGFKDQDEDKHTYVIDDCILPLPRVFECVQHSGKKLLRVSVAEKKEKKDYFGELYAHFLIEGHTHTTHYVNMAEEFSILKDISSSIDDVSSRCNKSDNNTKIIVLIDLSSMTKKKNADPEQYVQSRTSTGSVLSGSQEDATPEVLKLSSAADILKRLLEKLLVDGVDTVVVFTDADEKIALPTLFEEVDQRVLNKVSNNYCIILVIESRAQQV
jgi:hypothetical protein